MGCEKCHKESCSGGCSNNSMASMQSQIDALSGFIDSLTGLTKFLKGHPIIALDDPYDIAQFNFGTGKGSGDWIGWGICDGTNYPAATGSIITPDLRDRFIVGSQGSYTIGNVGGSNTVVLTVANLAAHNHTLTDPGHTHVINDPGHDHNVTDPGHNHGAIAAQHQHTFTTDVSGDHQHSYETIDIAGATYHIPPSIPPNQVDFSVTTKVTSVSGAHTHTGLTDMAVTAVTIDTAFTGIDMDRSFTGITNDSAVTDITILPEGSNTPHENRPPYFALLFVKKIF